jgi:hypothetical protein
MSVTVLKRSLDVSSVCFSNLSLSLFSFNIYVRLDLLQTVENPEAQERTKQQRVLVSSTIKQERKTPANKDATTKNQTNEDADEIIEVSGTIEAEDAVDEQDDDFGLQSEGNFYCWCLLRNGSCVSLFLICVFFFFIQESNGPLLLELEAREAEVVAKSVQ